MLAGGGSLGQLADPSHAWRTLELPEPVRRLERWEADVLHLPGPSGGGPKPPPARAMVLVCAGGFLLHLDLLEDAPQGEAACARAIESAVLHAADEMGRFPIELRLRRAELARRVGAALVRWRVSCESSRRLPGIDRLSRELPDRIGRAESSAQISPELED